MDLLRLENPDNKTGMNAETSLIIHVHTTLAVSAIMTTILFFTPHKGVYTPPSQNMLCMIFGRFRKIVQMRKAEPYYLELSAERNY